MGGRARLPSFRDSTDVPPPPPTHHTHTHAYTHIHTHTHAPNLAAGIVLCSMKSNPLLYSILSHTAFWNSTYRKFLQELGIVVGTQVFHVLQEGLLIDRSERESQGKGEGGQTRQVEPTRHGANNR